jgi:hypothetical protein
MVRHTHRRRQSRSRRRNTRRSRRTQRGGFSLFGFGEVTDEEIQKLKERLNNADISKKPEIQKELGLAQAKKAKQMEEANAEKKYKDTVERIEAGGAALSSTSVNNMTRSSDGRFQSSNGNGAANGMGMGTAASSSMFGGRRRRSHRRR